MRFFTKQELVVTLFIILTIFVVTVGNLNISLRRSRDSERIQSINAIANAVNIFQNNYGYFPPSENGMIKACPKENFKSVLNEVTEKSKGNFGFRDLDKGLRVCDWGVDSFEELLDEKFPDYLDKMPIDPQATKGVSFEYYSNGIYFQLYSHLEGESSEDQYRPEIARRGFMCGNEVCNFGRSSYDKTPLDKTIEEYEQELRDRYKYE